MKISKTSALVLLALSPYFNAQENISYQKPSSEILQLADYERPPSVFMDSKKQWLIFSYRNTYKTLEELNQDEMKLGGLRINPTTNISSTANYISNIKIRKINDKTETQIKGLPQNPKITHISFSPDEKKLAFTNTTSKGVELWVLSLENATAAKISQHHLNANLGTPYIWYRDSESILTRTIPENRPKLLDATKDLPTGPIVSTSDGQVSQNRTYQDLLKNPQDEQNFETLTTSEIHQFSLNGKSVKIKEADMYAGMSFSPDGNYLLITTIKNPFHILFR